MALVTDRSLFVHVQKSGGMSVRSAMRRCQGACYESGPVEVERHFGLPELRAAHPGLESGRLSFGFVRHPVSWLRSRWGWARASGYTAQARHRPSAARLWIGDCWSDDFERFIELYLERHAGVCTRSHFHMLGLWSDKPVDRVGRVENLADDLVNILGQAGEVFDPQEIRALGRVNASAVSTVALSPRLVTRILLAEAPMVDRFYNHADSQQFAFSAASNA